MTISDEGESSARGGVTVVETGFIVLFSLATVILAIGNVISRKFTGDGLPSGTQYVQRLTVWLGFLGALAATAGSKHLGLASGNLLPRGWPRTAVALVAAMVATTTCAILSWGSYLQLMANRVGTSTLAGGIPDWVPSVIAPIALGLIALRFAWLSPWGWYGRVASVASAAGVAALFGALGVHAGQLAFWPFILVVMAAFLLGAPVFVAMGGAAMLLFFHTDNPIAAVPTAMLQLAENPTLPAIPLLTLAGFVMASGKASERLVRAYKSVFGWLPGGLALMVISVCALFTTFTGGSGVTILALGGLLFPALIKDKYPEGFSLGLVTASGSLGLLFPPSLPVILYSAVAGVSAEKLYLGGLLPGTLLILVVAAYAMRVGIVARAPRQEFSWKEMRRAIWAAKWDLGLPFVVIFFFKIGWATIIEAAALGAAYALVVELVIYRDLHPLKQMPQVFVESATLVGAVVILLGAALGMTNFLVDAQVVDALVSFVQSHFHAQWTFLLALNALLLVLGSVFEIYAAIIVLAPLIAPLGALFNVEPVHLGVVFLANLELGFLFPPMGLNLFLSASRFGRPLPYLYKQALPFLLIMAVGVLFITYVPAITTGVVHLFGG